MKQIIKFTVCIFLFAVVSLASCKKNPVIQPRIVTPRPSVHDSLRGREFLYNDLVWETWGGPYVEVEVPNSYLLVNRGIEVFIPKCSLA